MTGKQERWVLEQMEGHCCVDAVLCRHLAEADIADAGLRNTAAAGCTAGNSCLVLLHLDHTADAAGIAGNIQLHRVHHSPDLAVVHMDCILVAVVLAAVLALELLVVRSCLLQD